MRTAVVYHSGVKRIMCNTDDSMERVLVNISDRAANGVAALGEEIAVRLPRNLDFDGYRLRTKKDGPSLSTQLGV